MAVTTGQDNIHDVVSNKRLAVGLQTCPLCLNEISNIEGPKEDLPGNLAANWDRAVSECVPMDED
jgi:hypothetical protein